MVPFFSEMQTQNRVLIKATFLDILDFFLMGLKVISFSEKFFF